MNPITIKITKNIDSCLKFVSNPFLKESNFNPITFLIPVNII